VTFAEVIDQALAMLQRRENLGNIVVPSAICQRPGAHGHPMKPSGGVDDTEFPTPLILRGNMATVLTAGLDVSSA
jgi:hypothetical protein